MVRRVQGAWYLATGQWPLLSYAAAGIALRPWSKDGYDGAADPARLLALATSLGSAGIVLAHWRQLRWTLRAEALVELGFAVAAGRRTRTYGEKRA